MEFSNGDSPPPVLAERLESFTAPNAADGYAELVHALSTCPTVHLALGGTTVSGTIASSGTAQLGVPSDAYQVVGTSAGATVDVGIVVFRRGPVLGALFYSSPSGDPVVLSNYARRAVDKLGSIG